MNNRIGGHNKITIDDSVFKILRKKTEHMFLFINRHINNKKTEYLMPKYQNRPNTRFLSAVRFSYHYKADFLDIFGLFQTFTV